MLIFKRTNSQKNKGNHKKISPFKKTLVRGQKVLVMASAYTAEKIRVHQPH